MFSSDSVLKIRCKNRLNAPLVRGSLTQISTKSAAVSYKVTAAPG